MMMQSKDVRETENNQKREKKQQKTKMHHHRLMTEYCPPLIAVSTVIVYTA